MFDKIVDGIHVRESENPPDLVDMRACGAFLFSDIMTTQFKLRRVVCEKIVAAQKSLPPGCRFLVYEGFRPRLRQIELWDALMLQYDRDHPDWGDERRLAEGRRVVAYPHGFGSGHQAGAAVDITLCDAAGNEFYLGTKIDEFNDKIRTDCPDITPDQRRLRDLLRAALENEGLINYPDEWWHFSYGDRLWAEVTGGDKAFFAPVD